MKTAVSLFLVFCILFSCAENVEKPEEKTQRLKQNLDNLMKCESCSIGLQSIKYVDSLNQTHSENAYVVLDNEKLIYFTVNDCKVVLKDQVISYEDIKLLRFHGKEPQQSKEFLKGLQR
jgi:hypothetical protein